MQNYMSLRPNPTVTSYLKHFQTAQMNLNLFKEEERVTKRRRRFNRQMIKTRE